MTERALKIGENPIGKNVTWIYQNQKFYGKVINWRQELIGITVLIIEIPDGSIREVVMGLVKVIE
jgi:hypothetical protein